MIRILQVLPRLRRGGSQAMVMNLYRALNREQYQFDFIIFTKDHDDYYDEIQELGGKIYHLTKFNGKNTVAVIKEWNKFFDGHKEYKILHSHVRSFASIYIPIAKKHGLVTIIHSHSTSNGRGLSGVVKAILEYPLRYQADYLFACSTEAGEWLFGEKSIKKANYRFIPNAINIEHFKFIDERRNQIRNKLQIDNKFVIGHVGGFETPKNHTGLIDIFFGVLKRKPNSILLLVGDGTYEDEIRNKCIANNISERVFFAGLQADVAPYLDAMDAFVFPSFWEGLPVSVVEAQTSGLRCFISDRITEDVNLTDLVMYLPLGNQSVWVDQIVASADCVRAPASDANLNGIAMFDDVKTIRNLETFYKTCAEKNTTMEAK